MGTTGVTLDFSTALPIADYELPVGDGQDNGLRGAGYDGAPQGQDGQASPGQQQADAAAPAASAGKKQRTQARAPQGDPRFFAPSSSPGLFASAQGTGSGGTAGLDDVGQAAIARRLGMSLGYAAQQNPDHFAYLLRLQDSTGISPVVSAGHETKIEQWLDANRIDPEAFTIHSPRTANFFSDPIDAAVAGVQGIQQQARIERNASVMRSSTDGFSTYTPTFWDKAAFNMRQATKFVTGKTTDDLVQSLYEDPLTRLAIATVGGTVGQVGDLGSMAGWHGDGPTQENLFQRTETGLKPETVFAGDPIRQYAYYAHTNGLEVAAPIVAGFMTGLGEETLVGLGLSRSGLSQNAIKVASRLAVALTFAAESGGQAYTRTAASGGSDDDARSAADRTFAINLPANLAAGFADKIPWLNKFPVLASALAGGFMGGSAQLANNLVDGKPWNADLLSQAGKSAAMQAGLHFGFGMLPGEAPGTAARPGIPAEFGAEFAASPHLSALADAVETAKESKLKERAPDRFYAANQANFDGDPNLRIVQEPSSAQPIGQRADTAEVAQAPGSASPLSEALPGGVVQVSPPDFLSASHEQQTAALPDVIAPGIDLSARELRDGRVELQQWLADGGLERLQISLAQNHSQTAAPPPGQTAIADSAQEDVEAGAPSEGAGPPTAGNARVSSESASTAETNSSGTQHAETGETVNSPAAVEKKEAPEFIPWGFANADELQEFKSTLSSGLANADPESETFLRGSAVTGRSYRTGRPFDTGRRSDLDVSIASPKLMEKAKSLGIDLWGKRTRTRPLEPADLKLLGLSNLANTLSKQANRKVSFMIYKSAGAIRARGESYISLK